MKRIPLFLSCSFLILLRCKNASEDKKVILDDSDQPVEPNDSEENKQKNRWVEILVMPSN